MNKMTVLLLSATIISGCTSSVPLIKKTQSGKPEGVYQNTTKDKVKDALVNYCNSRGLIITTRITAVLYVVKNWKAALLFLDKC